MVYNTNCKNKLIINQLTKSNIDNQFNGLKIN